MASRDDVFASTDPFRLLVESVRDYAIFALDVDGRVATWNIGAERMKQYSANEIIGQHFSMFYTPEDRERDHPAHELERAEKDGRYEEEGWRVRKDGTRFFANVVITALRGPDGQLRGFAKVTRDITDRRRFEEELKERIKEREVLLQEVHHRVKNNLQVISSLMNMQRRQVTDAAVRASLDDCKSRVEAIALIHEKLYQSRDYANVPFSEYTTSLALNLFHATGTSLERVRFEVDIHDIALGVDRAIPCGLVFNELLTNVLKHAFPEGRAGKVRLFLHAEGNGLVLGVEDDGVGLSEGFDIARSKSLGMKLVSTLAEQLGGALTVLRLAAGTRFEVRFPL